MARLAPPQPISLLGARRIDVTCEPPGPHSGYPSIHGKDGASVTGCVQEDGAPWPIFERGHPNEHNPNLWTARSDSAILLRMTDGRLPLPDEFLPKTQRYMRALRRGVLSYWYATLEDAEAAAIEAATATWYVNVLDESVFEKAFEEQYQRLRAKDRLGRVVMGLELIRNCETHAPVVFDGLLVDTHWYGVPRSTGAFTVRRVFAWADADALPETYRDVSSGATSAQRRARAEAQDGYRKDVEGRHVIETLFDAMAFFHSLDGRLVGPPAASLRWSFAEIPDTDLEVADPTSWYLARPLGLDAFELFLPSLACRDSERRTARWPPPTVPWTQGPDRPARACRLRRREKSCMCSWTTARSSATAASRPNRMVASHRGSSDAAKCGRTFARATATSWFMRTVRSTYRAPPTSESGLRFRTTATF
jgi:hypothetical protein